MQGHLTWDTTQPDVFEGDPTFGRYVFQTPPSEFALDTPTPLTIHAFQVDVRDRPTGDSLFVTTEFLLPNGPGFFQFNLFSVGSSFWSSDDLPTASVFSAPNAQVASQFHYGGPGGGFVALITSFERVSGPQPPDPPATVPEPASLLLLGTGLVGATRLRRRAGRA